MAGDYLDYLRSQIIGHDLVFMTPFGPRNMFYADYTASGRSLQFIEERLLAIQKVYANTHTEDDFSGKSMTSLMHRAETRIKELVRAGEHGKIFPVGSGSTGALKKLQEMIGVYIPPVTRERIDQVCDFARAAGLDIASEVNRRKPVIFVGPYEHHTNELMWREAFAEVRVVCLGADGMMDLEDLKDKISDPSLKGRIKFGSFSAGSNITGIRTRVFDVARICHRHGAFIFFDFAAVAPYIEIDMNRDAECYFDAIFFSPHKFLGGPGSSGILVMNEKLYRKDLSPTTAGGGTVVYVGFREHDFADDIETRESAGTPPILQTIKAALAMEVKEKIGVKEIEEIDARYLMAFLREIRTMPQIELVGPYGQAAQTPIVSFNIRHKDRILHPKFVTKLLNDLFGIQSRAGCSCAGPYGHILLDIDDEASLRFREIIACGFQGIKPGWVRINLHYSFTPQDVDFLVRAIQFAARKGPLFLQKYVFHWKTGEWRHLGFRETVPALTADDEFSLPAADMTKIRDLREAYFLAAEKAARELESMPSPPFVRDSDEIERLKNFYYVHAEGRPSA